MINAKDELLEHINGRDVDFIKITFGDTYAEIQLKIEGTLSEVIKQLDFNYDEGFGGQNLFGNIWYTDGTWSDRGEYDGSEWWQHQEVPSRY